MTDAALPTSLQAAYDALLVRPLQDENTLRVTISVYLTELNEQFMSTASAFNLELAEAIGHGCLALLDDYDARPEDERRAIQAACVYFIEDDDDDPDLASVVGFDDDAMVFNHVANALGRADLVVSL